MTFIVVEGCVTSPAEASLVTRSGAHRLELCRDLSTGGLTPGLEAVAAVREETRLPVFAMVRPRPGPFQAAPGDVASMLRQMENLLVAGVEGLVLGVLDTSGRIDVGALKELVDAARVPVTFHRAFDEVSDPFRALEQLRDSGVRRILTAGGRGSAWEGRETLQALVQAGAPDLTILGGGRVRGDHVRELVEETGLQEVHARASAIPGIVGALSS
jgi:copper homeostasis protein